MGKRISAIMPELVTAPSPDKRGSFSILASFPTGAETDALVPHSAERRNSTATIKVLEYQILKLIGSAVQESIEQPNRPSEIVIDNERNLKLTSIGIDVTYSSG